MRVVLIAAKQLAFAKSRLKAALPDAQERRAVAAAMFRDVLGAALAARSTERVAVVSSDTGLLDLASRAGALVIDEKYPRGLNVAVGLATARLLELGASCVCTILSDIPLVTGEDIDGAFAALPAALPAVVLVPSRDFSGTNMMVRRPPDAIGTHFGRLSLVRHLEDCRAQGVACQLLRQERTALDLDVPADLQDFERIHTPTHTQAHLARLGLLRE